MVEKDKIPEEIQKTKVDKMRFKQFIKENFEERGIKNCLYSDHIELNIDIGNSVGENEYPPVLIKVDSEEDSYKEVKSFFEEIGYYYDGDDRDNMVKQLVFKPD